MTQLIEYTKDNLLIFDSIVYRGDKIDFYEHVDPPQIFAVWHKNGIDTRIELEVNNRSSYIELVTKIIDYKLDGIFDFKLQERQFRLEYFMNAGHRDIRLLCGDRAIKIFLVSDQSKLDINELKAAAIDSAKIFLQFA